MKSFIVTIKTYISNQKGDVAFAVLKFAGLLIFIIFPIFSFILERYIIEIKANDIRSTIDMTNAAAYYALYVEQTSKTNINMDNVKLMNIYQDLLAKNLRLNADLTPKPESYAEGQVVINSLIMYSSGAIPNSCPDGNAITKPTIHSVVTIPIKPALYRAVILNALGRSYIELQIHTDTELPVNN